jgi:hypothetical protein
MNNGTQKHTPGKKWWGAFDAQGELRATCDSESEAKFYVQNRGHMYGGSYRLLPIRTDAAPDMLAALRDCLTVIEFEASASGKLDDVKRSEGYKKARSALERAGAA